MILICEGDSKLINLNNFEQIKIVKESEHGKTGFFVAGVNKVASFESGVPMSCGYTYHPRYVECVTRLTPTVDEVVAGRAYSKIVTGLCTKVSYMSSSDLLE